MRRWVAAALFRVDQLHVIGDDLGYIMVDAVLIGPFTGLQPALDIELGALVTKLAHDFGEPAEGDDAVPVCMFALFLRRLVCPHFRSGDGKIGDGVAVRHIAQIGIIAEVAHNGDAVYASSCHSVTPVLG